MRRLALIACLLISACAATTPAATTRESSPSSVLAASAPAAAACSPVQDLTTRAQCLLIPGTLVEIVANSGPGAGQTVRIRFESAKMSAEFGNPALFEADARTDLRPAAPTIAATGATVGSRVVVAFEGHGATTASGAYLLTRFVVIP